MAINTFSYSRTFLIISTFITLASSAELPSESHPTFNCLAAYAKTKGISDPAFDTVKYDSTNENCVQLRHKFISDIRKEIRTKIAADPGILPKYSNCIFEKLTGSEPFVNSIIKAAALEFSDAPDKDGKRSRTVDTAFDYISSSAVSCKSEADLADEFDALFESEKKVVKNLADFEEEYCVKKYLIKNNLVDTVLYNIDPNPHTINTTKLNCEEMIKKSNDDIYDQLGMVYLENTGPVNTEKVECALEKFREADYFDLMMKIRALTSVDITPAQRINERENFVRILSKISSSISSC